MTKKDIQNRIKKGMLELPFRDSIKALFLFGSYLNGTDKDDSDIDLVAEFNQSNKIGLFEMVKMQNIFEKYLGRKVDLLTANSLSPYFKKDVLEKAEKIYEK